MPAGRVEEHLGRDLEPWLEPARRLAPARAGHRVAPLGGIGPVAASLDRDDDHEERTEADELEARDRPNETPR